MFWALTVSHKPQYKLYWSSFILKHKENYKTGWNPNPNTNIRGGEWFFKKSGSRKILVEFHGSRSLVFLVINNCASRSLVFYMKVSNTLKSRSRNLKSQNVSGSQRKMLVSPSRIYHSASLNMHIWLKTHIPVQLKHIWC